MFPNCTVPAEHCDIDHVVPFNHDNPLNGGWTIPENLQSLCRTASMVGSGARPNPTRDLHLHHLLKTAGLWQVRTLPDRTLCWRAPNGKHHITHPQGP